MASKFYKLFAALTLMCLVAVVAPSCSKDDDDVKDDSLVGKWSLTSEVVDEEDGGIDKLELTLVFNKDKTGYYEESSKYITKASANYEQRMDFNWSTVTDASGNQILKISYVSGDKDTYLFENNYNNSIVLWSNQYVQTGNVLNIYVGSNSVLVFKR